MVRGRDIYGDPSKKPDQTPTPQQAKANKAETAKRLGAQPRRGKK